MLLRIFLGGCYGSVSLSSFCFVIRRVGLFLRGSSRSGPNHPDPTPVNLPAGYDWQYNPANGHYYAINHAFLSWEDARIFSEIIGGHLVTITDNIENQFIIDNFVIHLTEHAWIGFSQKDQSWKWVTDEPFDYSYFIHPVIEVLVFLITR
jgi:hypothetical protein